MRITRISDFLWSIVLIIACFFQTVTGRITILIGIIGAFCFAPWFVYEMEPEPHKLKYAIFVIFFDLIIVMTCFIIKGLVAIISSIGNWIRYGSD